MALRWDSSLTVCQGSVQLLAISVKCAETKGLRSLCKELLQDVGYSVDVVYINVSCMFQSVLMT